MNPVAKKDKKQKSDVIKGSKTKDSLRTHGVEETLKKAAEEEAERQRLAAAAAEEARLAAQYEEELRLKKQESQLNEEDRQKDLMLWVKSIPLSDTCVDRMDRAFSDGSLVAEIIHHFCPRICDNRQYFRWNSKRNKISNWEALNHRVFPKLGFRLNDKQISNLLNPFTCGKFQKDCEKGIFLYKLLFRVRKELAARNPKVFEYKKANFVPTTCEKKPVPRKFVNFLEHPPFSKVEWLLEQGFYDKKEEDTTKQESKKSASYSKSEGCLQTFFPCNFSTYTCFTFDENDESCNEICLRPTISVKWAQPTSSCFFC